MCGRLVDAAIISQILRLLVVEFASNVSFYLKTVLEPLFQRKPFLTRTLTNAKVSAFSRVLCLSVCLHLLVMTVKCKHRIKSINQMNR